MPIIKSAIKKMRKDKKRTLHNKKIEETLKDLIKAMRKNPTQKALENVTSKLDKAVKSNLIHANKAGRLKSRLSKLITSSKSETKPKPTSKHQAKKPKPN